MSIPDPQMLLSSMSLAQKVGQVMMCEVYGIDAERPHPGNRTLFGVETAARAVRELHLGSVIYFRWTDSFTAGPRALAAASQQLQQVAAEAGEPGLLVATDQEQGPSSRFGPPAAQFPGAMALGAGRDLAAARRAAAVTGQELRAVGINLDFAPDADVNVNPANPVIGVRSFGSDPELVASMVAAQVAGYQTDAGIACCAKHFPGHGDTATDSHTGLPVIGHSRAEWTRIDAPPFRHAVAAGVDLIMSAHIRFPGLEPDGLPATLSRRVLSGLLREELGFDGVIITDSLQMKGVRQQYPDVEVAVRALEAGADMILMPPDPFGARDAVVAAVEQGRLSEEALDEKVLRVLRLKARRGILGGPAGQGSTEVGTPEHLAAAQQAALAAITLVHRGRAGLGQRLDGAGVLVCGWGESEDGDLTGEFAARLREDGARACAESCGQDPSVRRIEELARAAAGRDLVVCLTHDVAAGGAQARLAETLVATGRPVVCVSVGAPYDVSHLPEAATQLAAYSSVLPVARAVVDVIAGRAEPTGRLPVKL